MATAPTQIRIDSDVKKQANDLFSQKPEVLPVFYILPV